MPGESELVLDSSDCLLRVAIVRVGRRECLDHVIIFS